MGRRYSFITYLFLQMCTWHIFLFPASGIRPSYTRHLISGSRHRFFMIFIRSWCHMGLLLYSSHSSQHGHMRTLYNTKYFQSFLSLTVCYLSPASVCGIFLSCCQRQDIFSQKDQLPAAGVISPYPFSMFIIHDWCFLIHYRFSVLSPAFYIYRPQLIYSVIFLAYFDILSFAMYWLLPEAALLLDIITYPGSSPCSAYLHALLFCHFLLLSVIDDTSFLLHINFSCSLVYVSFIIDIFFLFHRNFACFLFYLYHLWLAYLLLLLILLHRLLLCTDCCRKLVFFWILSLITAAALALLYLHALFFYHLCLMCLFIPYTISNHLYMMFFLCTCGFPYGSYYQKCYFHHL